MDVLISQDGVAIDPLTVPTVTGTLGTIFLDGDWIPDTTPATTYTTMIKDGDCTRNNYDRRDDVTIVRDMRCYTMSYSDQTDTIEFQVNREFDLTTSDSLATTYATHVGKLPKILRNNVKYVVIHDGKHPWGGNSNGTITIHKE